MKELNRIVNKAGEKTYAVCEKLLEEFSEHLYGVEMGIAYGGGVEKIGLLWKDRGTIYGFDTFEDLFPKEMASDVNSQEVIDMYDRYNKEGCNEELSLSYQQEQLNKQNLTNVKLVKGLISKDSCNNIPKIHYGLLDMDVIKSTEIGYKAVKDRVIMGGYLCLHDVFGYATLNEWYNKIVLDPIWEKYGEYPEDNLAILRRIV